MCVTRHWNDSKTDEDRTGRVGAMCGNGNEADVTMGFASRLMPSTDGEKSCILALGSGIGLERDVGKTRNFSQPIFEFVNHLKISWILLGRGVRVGLRHSRPTERG